MTEKNEVLQAAARAVLSKKAEDPVLLDLGTLSSFTDAFLLCHGNSRRQVQAIADAVEEALRGQFRRKPRMEGYPQGEWILMDYGEIVVHVFSAEKREFFDLERLWGDAPRIELEEEDGDRADSAPVRT